MGGFVRVCLRAATRLQLETFNTALGYMSYNTREFSRLLGQGR